MHTHTQTQERGRFFYDEEPYTEFRSKINLKYKKLLFFIMCVSVPGQWRCKIGLHIRHLHTILLLANRRRRAQLNGRNVRRGSETVKSAAHVRPVSSYVGTWGKKLKNQTYYIFLKIQVTFRCAISSDHFIQYLQFSQYLLGPQIQFKRSNLEFFSPLSHGFSTVKRIPLFSIFYAIFSHTRMHWT